ncbi:alpha-hydroxy-acid oxidizing protein [bacterium M00.F.Ca.ET.228.01.1.1]|uniref:alpha-hydroxy acid oxidase n=1 Tax=Paraburkholderia phenoliruptrix TaxID=252970 RepID=UPI001091BA6E|nr:alpha-hydroxy acid oxidase [Paraburkholderia phenoliruptrix]TGP41419.1 alpha-hydroxy-acid oxidizing protein [bacterium M00.F.Ca.ET.228.01.1.1]TGR98076.1 alpha-hydroxy-acid oxidizing protein [bacterium M00.F.Ca.ET.191.01.1.1]TGU02266.1 alpha-hydroxy-acid oxidizing protein [bacterium M00.F.Ca.ET.155.01.1.1]MBW0447058.1 alpha-hydroxy-acid oxidizing protein [Paraburkholderia phenoliruptrix]MBW9101086.1 alpha-hydroxy-acid oxidizing protein [Paraburkholderia phenoliruptrix]
MKRRLYSGRDVNRAHSIDDLREMARRRLPNFCFEYIEGGAEDETTLRRNRNVFDEIAFLPRTLVNVEHRSQSRTLFGQRVASPFMIGPTGYSGLMYREGDVQLASAAAAAGIPFVLSNASTIALEDVVQRAGGRVWMQVYMYRTREFVAKLAQRSLAAGIEALVVTTDSAVFGKREWDLRNYIKPLMLDWRNRFDVLGHPRWMSNVLWPSGMPRFANLGDLLPPGQTSVKGATITLGQQLDPSLSWDDIRWLRDLWPKRLVVKGVLGAPDALRAVEAGVDGIVLSNHGGRQLDGAVSAMDVLPEVVDQVRGRLAVMLDGGFRRGSDILKAVALGADAVLLGRATTYGLSAGGQRGAARAIQILQTEVDRGLGLLGCSDIAALDRSYLRWHALSAAPARVHAGTAHDVVTAA